MRAFASVYFTWYLIYFEVKVNEGNTQHIRTGELFYFCKRCIGFANIQVHEWIFLTLQALLLE